MPENETDTSVLVLWGKMLLTLTDAEFEVSLKAWQEEADSEQYQTPVGPDPLAAEILEGLGDECTVVTRKVRLYEAAEDRARSFASGATAGGEGLARMVDVRRIEQKLRRARTPKP